VIGEDSMRSGCTHDVYPSGFRNTYTRSSKEREGQQSPERIDRECYMPVPFPLHPLLILVVYSKEWDLLSCKLSIVVRDSCVSSM